MEVKNKSKNRLHNKVNLKLQHTQKSPKKPKKIWTLQFPLGQSGKT